MTFPRLILLLVALGLASPAAAQPSGGIVRLSSYKDNATFTASAQSVTLVTGGNYGSLLVDINGAIGGGSTITISCSADGGTSYAAIPLNGPLPATTTDTDGAVTVAGKYTASIVGCDRVRALSSAWGTGSPVVTLVASSAGGASSGGSAGGSTFDGVLLDAAAGDPLTDTVNNALRVNIIAGAGSGGTAMTDDAAFTAATTSITPFGALFDAVAPDSVDEGDGGAVRMSANRNLFVNIRDNAGNERGLNIDASGQLAVTLAAAQTLATVTTVSTVTNLSQFGAQAINLGSGAVGAGTLRVTLPTDGTGVIAGITTSVVAGTGATHLGKAEDAIAASGDTGVATWAIAQAVPTATAADGDYIGIKATALGKLWTAQAYAEDLAHTDADPGAFLLGIRRDTTPSSSAGTAGDYSALNVDANGRLYTNAVLYDAAGAALTPATDKAEDAAHVSGDTGPVVMTRRIDTPATSSGTSGDYSTLDSSAEGAVYTTPIATAASGAGASTHAFQSAASTNATNVKAGVGNVYGIHAVNTTATLYFLRLYNLAASPTCSSATGFVESIPIPASTTGAGVVLTFPVGKAFTTGISYCFTGGGSSTDNTSAATGVYVGLEYK